MKKNFKTVAFLISVVFAFLGCASDGGGENPEVAPGTIGSADPALLATAKLAQQVDPDNSKVILFYYRPDGKYTDWGLWLWPKGGEGDAGYAATSGKAKSETVDGLKIGYWDISTLTSSVTELQNLITSKEDMNLIIRTAGWANKDPGVDQVIPLSSGNKHFMVLSGDSAVYTVADTYEPTLVNATSLSSNTIKLTLSVTLGLETSASDNGFVLTADGSSVTISDVVNYENQNNRYKNNAKYLLLRTASKIDPTKTYTLTHPSFKPVEGINVSILGAVGDSVTYDGDDLGLTLEGNKATFKTWAPIASDVELLLYTSSADVGTFKAETIAAKALGATTEVELLGNPAKTEKMTKDSQTGVWSCTIEDVSSYKYYKYKMNNLGVTYYVSDIWAKACSAEAIASQIVDINSASEAIPSGLSYGTKESYKNPFGKNGTEQKSNTDAIIYEMHITDWSFAVPETPDYSMNVGKYLDAANDKVINHIKDLGVTHVQLLPVFEFAETNYNDKYNWGYNPYHYNVPEGRYVTVGYEDGTQAVLELRTLIAKLHEAGIAVNMDVVYNHTSGTGSGSLYDSTVPYYFYRFTADGEYSNGSGCGNEINSENPMVKKYIIESLKHWMLDYHFNGFRFDLMGCLSKETMAEIYDELSKIDPNVMVYGEPWTGGTAAVVNGATQAVSSSSGEGIGAFDDDFRDSIKGAEFGGFKQGHVQGTYSDSGITTGLVGKSGKNNRNVTGKLGLGLHYVECHDNYTLFDKLAISYWQRANDKTTTTTGNLFTKIGYDGLVEVKAENKLAAAYVFLSQGTAFINGGQEFLRTKRGNENSYNTSNTSSTSTNGIDLTFKDTYSDVYNTYKGLIALRRANPSAFGANASAKAEKVSTGVTKYTTGDFLVYFNATDAEVNISVSGYAKRVDVSGGTPTEGEVVSTVPAKSFVILKK
ncbi:pullulanase-associated domain-containing protein [Treponema porcinum]|uniref:pullulanase-associated domain-containing protein n=1 Tax=Treponema porcinum TaxID=261392 RepID=UPI0023F519BF|nr:pullulanase-associated domain-containing protein [Treponema porcinum]MDD7125610.1 alpha-amylase family glycosyl hydrolase [Treponema porcinum]MDY5453142.1 alpha-amylase family glycosyl hydrolase [Treponema porcinum]